MLSIEKKQSQIYHVGLVDADLLCNGTRHPNLALLKIAGYFRDNGYVRRTGHQDLADQNTYELLTNESNFEELLSLDHIYVSCVFSFTLDDSPLLLNALLSDKKLSKKLAIIVKERQPVIRPKPWQFFGSFHFCPGHQGARISICTRSGRQNGG